MQTALRAHPRDWCVRPTCHRRVILNRWTKQRGGLCEDCYRDAVEREARDEERRQLKGYSDVELERI